MLELFLKKMGYFCKYTTIGHKVWGDSTVKSSTIHQMKSRLCHDITEDVLTPFIISKGEGYSIEYRVKVKNEVKELNYCLIEPKEQKEKEQKE